MDQLIVHHLIVHELKKQPEMAETELLLSKETLPITEQSTELVGRLDQIFERKNDLLQGFLAAPDESLFPAYYQNWLQEGRDRSNFIVFSHDTMAVLEQQLTGVIGAKGGYLLYADYTMEEQRMLGIYFIRETPGLVFVPDAEAIKLDTIQYLDVDHMAMAVRLLAGKGRNVQMIRHARTQSSISQYFTDWVGLDRPETSAELTYNFLEKVEELPVPKDKETGFAMNEGEFEKALLKYAAKQPQQTIRVKEFDEFFYGNEKPLQEMLADGDGALDDGFRVDKRSLRKQFYLRAGFGGLSITCTKDHFRTGQIEIDEAAGTITIRSDELANLLLDQKGD
ncbi:nucleoid-associated protein [Neolewinella lacunae]|uniref:Nucleoid-associated protein n=1 Tax=Neolewinella lacunae TaxID=1517758 RepID=A0A923PLE7_9BACT|nr:nucleoid-associated protein [Neolewinella lacunae]MBC6993826.1 nucleoid-associated protein [Neolewinella lacunae]MDN3635283.1 nucleoid-associated protein [Neolewinella lacunae]